MISVLLAVISTCLKSIFFCLILPYLLYYRVYDYYRSQNYYNNQKIVNQIPGIWGSYPLIGSIPAILKATLHQKKNNLNQHVATAMINMFLDGFKPIALVYFTAGTTIVISDPIVVEAMYTSKNKFFDKHPLVKELTLCLTGKSILFAETSREWKQARQTMSPAFYKGKLLGLVELARESVRFTTNNFKKITSESK